MKKPILHQFTRQWLLILCLVLLVTACSSDEPTPEPTAPPAPTATTAPAATPTAAQPESPLNAADSPLPTPTPVAATEAPVIPAAMAQVNPQTSATTGAVTGRIFINNEKGFRAIPGIIVGLAEVLKGEDGVEKAAGYDPSTAPTGEIGEDGTFVIDNVPPGRYGVILDAVTTSLLAKEVENPDNSLVITVEASKVTDLGNLVYPSIPLPGVEN